MVSGLWSVVQVNIRCHRVRRPIHRATQRQPRRVPRACPRERAVGRRICPTRAGTASASADREKGCAAMTSTTETGEKTGTKDKDYNLIWFTEACLSNALRLESYIEDADRDGDNDLAEFFRKAQADSRKGAEQGKDLLRQRPGGWDARGAGVSRGQKGVWREGERSPAAFATPGRGGPGVGVRGTATPDPRLRPRTSKEAVGAIH